MTLAALKQRSFAEEFISPDGTVETEDFGAGFVTALRMGYTDMYFDGLREMVVDHPAAVVELLKAGMEYANTSRTATLDQEVFRNLVSLSARAINHIKAPADKAAAATDLMDSLSQFIDGQGTRVFSVAQLYVTIPESDYPLTALNKLARHYGQFDPAVIDFTVAEARDHLQKGRTAHARAAGDTLTRFTKPNSADYALGIPAIIRPIEDGENVCDVLDTQATALARTTDNFTAHTLMTAIDATMKKRQTGPIVYTDAAMTAQVLLSVDQSGVAPMPMVEENIIGMMVASYFSTHETERGAILSGFSVIEDMQMQEDPKVDFGRTMIGMAGTRIAMIEHGIDRDSMYVAHLHEKGIALPAPKQR